MEFDLSDRWKRWLEPKVRPLFFLNSRLTRGMTLGVRGLVLNDAGQVLLVEHTYLPGWWLPGGGVDKGETAEMAVARELREEAGVQVTGRPVLVSVHSNHAFFPGDHVLLYRVEAGDWTLGEASSHGEIRAVQFFDPRDLPADTNPASRRRLIEAFEGLPPDPLW